MARLPIGAHDYLTHLNSLKEALEKDELPPAQKNLAEALLEQVALTRQRRMYIKDMVAAGDTDEEIKIAFASPDSPMNILISAFTGTDTLKKFQQEINEARKEYAAGGEAARLKAHIRQRQFLLGTVLSSITQAGATHHQSLLSLADAISKGIAELEGLQHARAGRTRTKQPVEEPPVPVGVTKPDKTEVDWNKEFVADDTND